MPKVKLQLPPGMARFGTIYQSSGRWFVGNLVRFFAGAVQPVGGWTRLQRTDSTATTVLQVDSSTHGVARSMLTWQGIGGKSWLAIGATKKLLAYNEGTLKDITPTGFTPGTSSSTFQVGPYGGGAISQAYGQFAYGLGDPTIGTVTPADSWQLDNFGQYLVACFSADGALYYWDLAAAKAVLLDATAPTGCAGIVVTPEHFVVALAAGNNPRLVKWASQDTLNKWDQDHVTFPQYNDGDLELQGTGKIMCGRRGRNETLIWTDADLYAMRYIGGTLVYGAEQIGRQCGAISRQSVAVMDGTAVWMGHRGFFLYDGYVKPLPSEVNDYVFSDFNFSQKEKVCAYARAQFGEVWFHYPSGTSQENDRYVVWNYRENHFTLGQIARTCGADRSPFEYPLAIDASGFVLEHEKGWDHENATVFLESGPRELGEGDQVMSATQLIPDDKHRGDVQIKLFGLLWPDDYDPAIQGGAQVNEETFGPYTLAAPTDIRMTARQVRVRVDEVTPGDWRFGIIRLDVDPDGER